MCALCHCPSVTQFTGVAPPSSRVVDQHKWDERTYPTFDMDGVFNAKHYGATGATNRVQSS